MASRGSEGEERNSRLSRSLSATRNFFKNRDNLDKSEGEDEIREHPVTPDVDISLHSSKPSSKHSESDSDSDSPSEKSSDYHRKKRWQDRTERKEKSDHRNNSDRRKRDRQKSLEAQHMEYTRSNPLGSALLDIVADNMALHKKVNFKESNLNIGNLCSAFHKHMEGEKEKIKNELE